MALRHQFITAFVACCIPLAAGAAIRAYPLDERCVYSICVGRDAPTTCVFPGAVTALEGAGIGAKPEDATAVLLSYQPGADFFSVRALKENATAALNVVFRDKVYVLCFTSGSEPDRAVIFLADPLAGPAHRPASTEMLRVLLDRAKQHARIVTQFPALAPAIARAEPNSVTHYPAFSATIEEVFRFDAEDVLVFRIRLKNPGEEPVRYDREKLAVHVQGELFPAALAEASGAIPPRAATRVFLAISGTAEGGRANLSVHEPFSVIVPPAP